MLLFLYHVSEMSATLVPVYLLYLADSEVQVSKLLQQLLPYIDIQYVCPNPLKQCEIIESAELTLLDVDADIFLQILHKRSCH